MMFYWGFRDPVKSFERKIKRGVKRSLFGGIKSKFSGKMGEGVVSFSISSCFHSKTKYLKDTYLHFRNGTSTQVDEIVISNSGIYVFEVKNYKGWIFGNQNNKNWTQVLYLGYGETEKNQFYNPIIQNRTHINCIETIIEDKSIPIHSIVVFTDKSEFKDLTYDPDQVSVIHRYQLKKTISSLSRSFHNSVSDEDIDLIYNQLLSNSLSTDKDRHKQQVYERKNNPSQDTLRCPLCNSKLVIRTSKRGDNIGSRFYGCSSFPKCRYTRNI